MQSSLVHFLRLGRLRGRVRLPIAEIEALQAERLRSLVEETYRTTPFYRDLMREAGLQPEDIRTAGDLGSLPVTDVETLRTVPEEMLGPPLDGEYEIRRTGGTSVAEGAPVVISREEAVERALITIRGDLENGYRIWRRQAFVDPPPFRGSVWYKRFGVLKSEYVSRFDELPSQLARLQAFRPFRLSGQPSALKRLAEFAAVKGPGELRPQLIHTLGERLRPATRTLLEEVFSAPVYDRYGATEVGIIGWECERQAGYHLNCDQLIVECVGREGPVDVGSPGSVVVTNLASRLRPFIRVDLGDIATMGAVACRCGRTFPLLAAVLGRQSEYLQHPASGAWLAPQTVEQGLEGVAGVKEYRLVQGEASTFELRVVADSEPAIQALAARVRDVLGASIELAIERRPEIPTEPSGKRIRVSRRSDSGGSHRSRW